MGQSTSAQETNDCDSPGGRENAHRRKNVKAQETNLLSFLKTASQFVIPIYQRTYSWEHVQCEQLWNDILRAGQKDDISMHFVGSVVYIQDGLVSISDSSWLVIDGQQRLTTVSLLLEALARKLAVSGPVEGFSTQKIREYYLTNPLEEAARRHKLILSETDKETLIALVDGKKADEIPPPTSLRLIENFDYFERQIEKNLDILDVICRGIAKLAIVDVALTQGVDNPQLIFESMNSTGKALGQADLIRNFMLMGLQHDLQSHLYKFYWRPMERDFGQEGYSRYFDSFMRHYLTIQLGRVPRIEDVYDEFKKIALAGAQLVENPEPRLEEIARYSKYFCRIYLGKEEDRQLRERFTDIILELRYTVATPLLLAFYNDYEHEKLLTRDEFLELLDIVESYVYRRQIVQIPTNSLNKTFAEFPKHIDKDRYLESAKAYLLMLPSYRRFPNDDEFSKSFVKRDLYNTANKGYWLRKLENHKRKEIVRVDEYTIEHLLPQNPSLNEDWQAALGENWADIQQQYLHTAGNLTLTAYNSQYSDKSFAEKRDMPEIGLRHSPLFLNTGLGALESWDETEIIARAERLAQRAVDVWGRITLPTEVLESYKPQETAKESKFTIEHFEYLKRDDVRELFQNLRGEILSIDPAVTEIVRKYYIAYKAETNFVDIIPQANSLNLAINMPFEELRDPRGLAEDVTGVGFWGNGSIRLPFTNASDLKYTMYLIRQSFDKQMAADTGEDRWARPIEIEDEHVN